jgi:hypothetical protein
MSEEKKEENVFVKPNGTCVCCGKSLKHDKDIGNLEGGVKFEDHAGYGSIHDMDKLTIYICDDCIAEKTTDGIIEKSLF